MSYCNHGICLIGGGGHARAVEDVIYSLKGYSISLGGPVEIGDVIPDSRRVDVKKWAKGRRFVLGVGQIKSVQARIDIVKQFSGPDCQWPTIISSNAYVSPTATIGQGVIIMHNAVVNAGAIIGEFCIINTGAIVEHDVKIGYYTHISTGAVVNGEAGVGRRSFVGSNAVVLNQIRIGNDVILGAGSVAVCDIMEPGIYRGNPCGRIK